MKFSKNLRKMRKTKRPEQLKIPFTLLDSQQVLKKKLTILKTEVVRAQARVMIAKDALRRAQDQLYECRRAVEHAEAYEQQKRQELNLIIDQYKKE